MGVALLVLSPLLATAGSLLAGATASRDGMRSLTVSDGERTVELATGPGGVLRALRPGRGESSPARLGWADGGHLLRVESRGGEPVAALRIEGGRARWLRPEMVPARSVAMREAGSVVREDVAAPDGSPLTRVRIGGRSLLLVPGRPTAADATAIEEEAARRGLPARVAGTGDGVALPVAVVVAALLDDLLPDRERAIRRRAARLREAIPSAATVERTGGAVVLRARGTPYEIGFAHGRHLAAEIRERLARDGRAGDGNTSLLSHLPLDRREEIRGIADGASISLADAVSLSWRDPGPRRGRFLRRRVPSPILVVPHGAVLLAAVPARGRPFLAVVRPGSIAAEAAIAASGAGGEIPRADPLAAILLRHAVPLAGGRGDVAAMLAAAVDDTGEPAARLLPEPVDVPEAALPDGCIRRFPDLASASPPAPPAPFAPPSRAVAEPLRPDRLAAILLGCRVATTAFPSPRPSGDPVNDRVPATLLEPVRGRPRGAVVLMPIWKGPGTVLERFVASHLAARGWSSLVLPLPYQHERAPAGVRSGDRTISDDLERNRAVLVQAVADAGAARELLVRRGYRRDRIVVMGISLGGHVAALAHAVDPGFARGIFVLTGGDFADLLWNGSPMTRGIERRLRARGIDLDALRAACAPVEPLLHARPWRGAGTALVAATRDRIVPPANVRALRAALGDPATLWIDATHVSGITRLPRIARWIADRLDRGIGAEGASGISRGR